MENKFYNRFRSFSNSLDALAEAKERDMSDSFVLSGTAAKYSITMELAWKVMKDVLTDYHMISDFAKGSPKEVLKKSFEVGLIHDDIWIQMLKVRNELAHDFDLSVIQKYCEEIISTYIDKMQELRDSVEKIIQESEE